MLKLKLQYCGHMMQRTDSLEKTLMLGKDWRQEEKEKTEDEMVGWHRWLNGHEFEQAPGDDDGQGSLACCSPWDHKESDVTERLNWTEGHKYLCTQIAAAAVGVGHLFHIQVFSNSKAYYIPTKKWIKTQDVSQRTPRRSVRTGLKKWKANISWYSEHYANASSECPLRNTMPEIARFWKLSI